MRPDPNKYNPDPAYLRKIIKRTGMTQTEIANNCMFSYRSLLDYLNDNHPSKVPYSVQFCIEALRIK